MLDPLPSCARRERSPEYASSCPCQSRSSARKNGLWDLDKRPHGTRVRSQQAGGRSYSADRKFLQSISLASITFVSNMDTSH